MITIKQVTDYLEGIAPLSYQESYDNAGAICGASSTEVKGILICLDSTEAVIDEAIRHNCNLVVAHHPIIFSGIKKLNGKNYIERTIIKAIKNDITIYAAHTNLDNISEGVNKVIADRLGLINCRILSPKKNLLKKLVTFCPVKDADKVRKAMFDAGGGRIGKYDECSFNTEGTGTFRGSEGTNPHVGKPGEQHHEKETRVEMIFEAPLESRILSSMIKAHPYEEVAYDIYPLDNTYNNIGSGMIGDLPKPMKEKDFLLFLKEKMNTGCVRYTPLTGNDITKVAVCGGSGSFLLQEAISQKANVLVTSDFKYHQFFDAEGKIVIADIGHYESEQFTKQLFLGLLKRNFSTFALRLSEVVTNPITYI